MFELNNQKKGQMLNVLFGIVILILLEGCSTNKKVYLFEDEKYSRSYINNYMGSYLVDRKECAFKKCGKAIFFLAERWHGRHVYIIDFDKKEWNMKSVYKSGSHYTLGAIQKYRIFEHLSIKNKYNFQDLENNSHLKNIYYFIDRIHNDNETLVFFTKFFTTNDYVSNYKFNQDSIEKQGYKLNRTLSFMSVKNQNKKTLYIQKFIDNYKLNNLVGNLNSNWIPANSGNAVGITGKGRISFTGNSNKYFLKIEGEFKNGVLISDGKIIGTKLYSDGGISPFRDTVIREKKINPSTNIRQAIHQINQLLSVDISDDINQKQRERSQTYSSSTNSGNKTFTCTYSCLSDVGLLYETYRNVGSVKISSDSYSSAMSEASDIARKRCKNTSDKHGHKMRGGSADCDFGR